jgi:hypothetical protein
VSSVGNGLYFLTLPLVSVMRIIYTSEGMLKKFGVRVVYQKIRQLEGFNSNKSFTIIIVALFIYLLILLCTAAS